MYVQGTRKSPSCIDIDFEDCVDWALVLRDSDSPKIFPRTCSVVPFGTRDGVKVMLIFSAALRSK